MHGSSTGKDRQGETADERQEWRWGRRLKEGRVMQVQDRLFAWAIGSLQLMGKDADQR